MTIVEKLSSLSANMREVASGLATMGKEGARHAAELEHAAGLVDQWAEAIDGDQAMKRLPSDISRCTSSTCLKRFKCLRFLDSPTGNPMQSYDDLTPPYGETECGYFIAAEDE